MREIVPLNDECKEFMRVVMHKMNLSGRVFDRLIKVGRTIADLAGAENIEKTHLAEAVQYRERVTG